MQEQFGREILAGEGASIRDDGARHRRDAEVKQAIWMARQVKGETDRFLETWSADVAQDLVPAFSWDALARQLKDLAESPAQADLVDGLLFPIRRWAPCKPPEMVLRELLCLAAVVLSEEPSMALAGASCLESDPGAGER